MRSSRLAGTRATGARPSIACTAIRGALTCHKSGRGDAANLDRVGADRAERGGRGHVDHVHQQRPHPAEEPEDTHHAGPPVEADLDEDGLTVNAGGIKVRPCRATPWRSGTERRSPMSFDSRGYVISADAGDSLWVIDSRMTVLAGGDQTGGAFTLLEWAAPRGFGPPRHIHHQEDEAFYLLDGEMAVECGDRGWTVGPGDLVFLPRGIAHAFVVSKGPVRGLQLTSPAGFERFITEVGRPAERAGLPEQAMPDIGRLSAVMSRYGYEMVGPPLTLPAESAESPQ